MPLLHIRAVEPYQPGDNATDVIVNQVHFNRTALDDYHFTLYSNGTLSNGSDCYLAFQIFQPHMFWENGTFVNGTSCFAPIRAMGSHGSAGLAFAILFVISIACSLLNLRKHGQRYLPYDRRWSLLGRRIKWIWLLFVAACGAVSGFMSIDVDRGYLQGTPIVIQSIFYTLMTPALMAAVWEAVRNWGSWQEHIVFDRDPYAFTKRSTRSGQEFLLPILFYICAIANLVLTVPRSWTPIEYQRSPEQELLEARPSATDQRWRAAGFVALASMLITCYSLEHSIYRYRARPHTLTGQMFFYITGSPSQFLIALGLLGVKIGYAIASSFEWGISPLNAEVDQGYLYGLGYTPVLLIIILFNVCGYCDLNEDKAIISLRDELDAAVASDTAFGQKNPHWWRRQKQFPPPRFHDGDPDGHGDGDGDVGDLDRYVELGIIHRNEGGEGEEEKKKEDGAQITTTMRSNSQTSESSGVVGAVTILEPERNRHQMEYVVQPGNLSEASRRESGTGSADVDIDVAVPQRERSILD